MTQAESYIDDLRARSIQHRRLATERETIKTRMQADHAVYKELTTQRDSNVQAMLKILEQLDCTGSVNYGWEGRVIWMLSELTSEPKSCPALNDNSQSAD